MREATLAVHGGHSTAYDGSVTTPIFQSSTYIWESFEQEPKWVYARASNPNKSELESVVAALEGAQFGVTFGSGIAAISAAIELAQAGDHVLIAQDIYGGTHNLARHVLPRHGVDATFFDSLRPETIKEGIKPNTKLIVFESPTNPTLKICDIAGVVAEAKRLGLITVFDNTFATPILQKPLSHGVDVVCHSTTKYLGGHSDVVGGVAVTNQAALHQQLFATAVGMGGVPGPFDCWLVCRGIKSLLPRMRMQCDNAFQVANFLVEHPKVARVHYPGLKDAPGHELAKKQMTSFGAMLSFEVKGSAEVAMKLGAKCKIFKMAASLGGVESLISYPTKLSHSGMTENERISRGIPPTLLRVSVGLEDPLDLIEDLEQALR